MQLLENDQASAKGPAIRVIEPIEEQKQRRQSEKIGHANFDQEKQSGCQAERDDASNEEDAAGKARINRSIGREDTPTRQIQK